MRHDLVVLEPLRRRLSGTSEPRTRIIGKLPTFR